jgi:hypothetical protein
MQKRYLRLLTGMCLTIAATCGWSRAQLVQDGPPKVLVISVEDVKPGKAGAIHQRTESAFAKAARDANSKNYHLGLISMSGSSRAAFLFGYDSFEQWEQMDGEAAASPQFAAALDRAWVADGDLLTDYQRSAYRLRPELSYGPSVKIALMRYFDVGRYKLRAGHEAEFAEAVKMWGAAMGKLDTDLGWSGYQSMLGKENGGVVLIFTPMKSLSALDRIFGNIDKLPQDDSSKRMGELFASSIETRQHNLFKFSPALSYPPPEWVKEDPGFWKVNSAK